MNKMSIFNQKSPSPRLQKSGLNSFLPLMVARYSHIVLALATILTSVFLAGNQVSYGGSVAYKTPCDQLRESKDSYLKELKVLDGACRVDSTLPLTFDAGTEQLTADQLTPHLSMERGTDTLMSASFIGGSIISKEEMANCAYSHRQEITGPISRFRFASDEENRLINTYSQLLSGSTLKEGHLNCASIVDPPASSLCQMIGSRSLSPASLATILEDIRKSLSQVLAKHDQAAGLRSSHSSECSQSLLKIGYSPETMLRLSRLSSGGSLDLSQRTEGAERSDALIQAAERHRLDRVYLDFIKSRIDLIRRFEGSKPNPKP